jgi:beta-lactamase superfamily II metal-dependent hydrolase
MLDIDNSRLEGEDGLTDPVAYLKKEYPNRGLFRFILTHPDMDHMSGLHELSQGVAISNFWDTENTKSFADSDWENSPYDRADWDAYQRMRASANNPRCIRLLQDATSECCWTQDGVRILAPTAKLVQLGNEGDEPEFNHLSYVLRVSHAGRTILFGGDATVEAWDEIKATCGAAALKADIFVAPHHGSKYNVNETVFKDIAPDYVIVSVATGVDYDYTYYDSLAAKAVLSTKHYGTMKMTVKDDGTYLPITVEKNGGG